MSGEGSEFKVLNMFGGIGGGGGQGGISGGAGGLGQGPTVNFGGVQNLENNILEEVLYKWLGSPPTTQDRQHELRNLHHEATGHWLQDDIEFMEWKTTPGALWIKGTSGKNRLRIYREWEHSLNQPHYDVLAERGQRIRDPPSPGCAPLWDPKISLPFHPCGALIFGSVKEDTDLRKGQICETVEGRSRYEINLGGTRYT
ncbi:hypothetical protein B0H16DRAFT_1828519 [Mycena metata]|uniref:Uncharacterized protein n=1 Tax=Mycena metata TaxID=1033252 RepID=A0AAD7GSD3_9AGAR|nr:hypothetical protein B0H16DRAFT_1828519 [Mycena metata]